MPDTLDIEIIPEDKIHLTQEQKNLIELAFIKQVPPEDAKILERIQKVSKNKSNKSDPFLDLSIHFTTKYGIEFGTLYLAAIVDGKKKYKKTLKEIEKLRAEERMKKEKS